MEINNGREIAGKTTSPGLEIEVYDFMKYLQQNINASKDLMDFTLSNLEYEQPATSFNEENKVFKFFRDRSFEDKDVRKSAEVDTPENARLTFEDKAREHARAMIDEHFDFYKKINDDKDFRDALLHMMYQDFQRWMGLGRGHH